jgi:hypothetical protein|tara:strand:+ start:480 stop:668 length:189 start_codon:yes stop_codon:yes gene_type:complete
VTEDIEKIKESLERLKNSSMEIGKAIYSQTDSSESTASDEQQQEQQPEEEKKEEEKKDEEKK